MLSGKPNDFIPIMLGIMAALVAGQLTRTFNLGAMMSLFITIIIAVAVWYIFSLLKNKKGRDAVKSGKIILTLVIAVVSGFLGFYLLGLVLD